MPLSAIVVDDEELSLDIMGLIMESTGLLEIKGKFTNPLDGLKLVEKEEIDVVFLDIEMPGINGLEVAERILQLKNNIQIVFVTAYSEHAVEAFEINALDYLLKPVTKDRLLKTLSRLSPKSQKALTDLNNYTLKVQCFKSLEVVALGQNKSIVKWRTAKSQELFAYLWHNQGNGVDKYKIAEMLWPDMDLEKALTNLHTTIYYLRKTFSNLGFTNLIKYNNGQYKLEMADTDYDVAHFNYIFEKKYNNPTAKATALLELYRGDYLENEGYHWAEDRRRELRLKIVQALSTASQLCQQEGDMLKALDYLDKIIKIDFYEEKAHREFMKIYSLMGRRIEAIKHYENFKKKLLEDLGVNPETETQSLFNQLVKNH